MDHETVLQMSADIMAKREAELRAIEFGEYLAKAADQYIKAMTDTTYDADAIIDSLRRLRSAVYEFRKRASKALTNS